MRTRYVDPRCFTSASFFIPVFAKHRIGSYNLNFMVVQTLLSTMFHLMPLRLLTGTQCLPFNSILRPQTLLSLTLASRCLMVCHCLLHTLIRITFPICLGMVSSIVDNQPAPWSYGCVLEQP